MGLIPESYLEQLQWFSEQLKNSLMAESPEDARIVQTGFILYRQGAVSQLKLEQDGVSALVQDVNAVKVFLDLDIPSLSNCTCPAEGVCRHQMAVFFKLLSYEGSVSAWMDEWRKPLQDVKTAKNWGISRAKDLLKTAGVLKPDYKAWTDSFRESFGSIMKGNGDPRPYVINELFSVYKRRIKAGAPLEQEWKNLYLLIGAVISFDNLLQLSIELKHDRNTIKRHYWHAFQDLTDEILELSSTLAAQSLPFAFDDFIEQLKDDTDGLLLYDFPIDYDRTNLFCILWTRLYKQKKWREERIEKLSGLPEKDLPVTVGLIHLHLLLRHDGEAMTLIKTCGEEIAPYFFYWLDLLTAQRDWKRLESYVTEFILRLREFISWQDDYYGSRQFAKVAIKTITSYCTEADRPDLYERALTQMLPYSFHDYEDLLFEKKEFEKWMELYTYAGFDLASVSKERIKLLKAESPEVLLPLYHQAIQADIDGKNRERYRQAVKKLKKLRTIYKQIKRLDDWEQFLNILLTRTKRLRAFQEECKRGKLIDA